MKKFFSAILLFAVMAFSVSTFVSCNDLSKEMSDVTAQAGANKDEIAKLKNTIADLQNQIATLNQGIAAAEQAAQKAKDAADAAAAVADEAAAAAADAAVAAANAKKDAIEAAKDYADDILEQALAAVTALEEGKVADLEADIVRIDGEIANLAQQIAAIDAKLLTLKAELEKYTDEALKSIAFVPEKIDDELGFIADEFISLLRCEEDSDHENYMGAANAYHFTKPYEWLQYSWVNYWPSYYQQDAHNGNDAYNGAIDSVPFEFVDGTCVDLTFRINPANAAVSKDDLSFIAIEVETRAAETENVFTVLDTKRDGDKLTVTVKSKFDIKGDYAYGKQYASAETWKTLADLVALKVSNDKYTLVSDYVAVADNNLYNYLIYNKVDDDPRPHFNVEWWDAWKDDNTVRPYELDNTVFFHDGSANDPVELPYDETIDLRDYVVTMCNELGNLNINNGILDGAFECMPVTYTFSLPAKYIANDFVQTNEQEFVQLKEDGYTLYVKPHGSISGAAEHPEVAVGKTPIVEVVAWVNGKEIARAFIKVDIVEAETFPVVVETELTTYNYTDLLPYDATLAEMQAVTDEDFYWTTSPSWAIYQNLYHTSDYATWQEITEKALAAQGILLSNEQFIQVYDVYGATYDAEYTKVVINGVEVDPTAYSVPFAYIGMPEFGGATTTAWVGYGFNSWVQENSEGIITAVIEPNPGFEAFYPEVTVNFYFKVQHTPALHEFNGIYNILDDGKDIVLLKRHATPGSSFDWSYELYMHEAFKLDTYYDEVCGVFENHSPWAVTICDDEIVPGSAADYARLFHEVINPRVADQRDWEETIITIEPETGAIPENVLSDFNPAIGGDGKVIIEEYMKAGKLNSGLRAIVRTDSGKIDVPVMLYSVLDNGNTCEFHYDIRFINPFDVTLKPAVLATDLDGEKYNVLATDITITYDGTPVYENGDYTVKADELGLRGHLSHEYSIIASSVNDEIAKGRNDFAYYSYYNWLHWTDKGMIYWNNGGTVLNSDVKIDATVYGYCDQIGWFTITEEETKDMVTLEATK